MSGVRIIHGDDLPMYLGEGGRRTRVLLDPATGHPGIELYEVELDPGAASEFHTRAYPEAIVVTAGTIGVDTHDTVHMGGPGTIILIETETEHRHVNAGNEVGRFLGIFAPPQGHAASVRKRRVL